MSASLVGSEMCIRDRIKPELRSAYSAGASIRRCNQAGAAIRAARARALREGCKANTEGVAPRRDSGSVPSGGTLGRPAGRA
eukprot:13342760-Alexandrium_andersonii.AAC.1